MRNPIAICTSLAVALALGACAGLTPGKLDDTVALFHDDVRWGRMPAAELSIAATMRARFERGHATWGDGGLQIVDLEVQSTRISGLTGIVRTRYVWMRGADFATRESLVETHWRGTGSQWLMDDERVIAGDPQLLASMDPPASAGTR